MHPNVPLAKKHKLATTNETRQDYLIILTDNIWTYTPHAPYTLKGKVYGACVRSSMIYGSETWAVNAEQEAKLERAEMRMVRWMCGVSLREKKTNAELRESMGIEKISDVMRRSRLRWMWYVLRKERNDWVKKSMEI